MNHYELLEISENADQKEINDAFLRLKSNHPNPSNLKWVANLHNAYETLSDAFLREEYDKKLRLGAYSSKYSMPKPDITKVAPPQPKSEPILPVETKADKPTKTNSQIEPEATSMRAESVGSEIERLHALVKSGAINDDEYNLLKSRIIGTAPNSSMKNQVSPENDKPSTNVGNLSLSDTTNRKGETFNTKQILGLIGSIVLFIGVFTPIVSVPIMGNMNYFQNGKGDGTLILILAVVSLVLVFTRKYEGLWLTGLGSFAVMAFTFINFQIKISDMKSHMEAELSDNPFRGLADMAMQSVQLQWGWAILIVGAGLVIASAAIQDENKVDR